MTEISEYGHARVDMSPDREYEPPLDAGIARQVEILRAAGIETFESCQGGAGHCYPEPTIRFYGGPAQGFRALAAAIEHGLKVSTLRRIWVVADNEPHGPWWEIVF